ncbi:Holliday junction branch migration protein RuvA [Paracerasibacillus soli]|uniref:Holliday junction branch migration protein RuvA n=2 Tax=Paracerasibacillus soli TaxID=480284 RepID=A0ABU5CRW5_9BACI|nr:Holliday junction branch migration protein RuvA [Virgibacillus soli]MDY0408569.1 Holliday junction branch migration protein RuvA [Virgibacillus soli]
MMGSVNIPDFVAAIEREDDKFLTSFPGIGKKTSRQIILDLKGKLISLLSTNEQTVEQQESQSHHAENIRETQEALKALGYKDNEIKRVLPILQKEENEHTDVLIRKALALLTK